jgi:hypothetical protein
MSCGPILNINGVTQPPGTAETIAPPIIVKLIARTENDPVAHRIAHLGIGTQIAAPAIGDHAQPQPPIRDSQDAPELGGDAEVMRQMDRRIELRMQQRGTRGEPAHDGIGAAAGERSLVHRLVHRCEQRHLNNAECQHGRQHRPRSRNRHRPAGAEQQGTMDAEAHRTVGVRPVGQSAQFSRTEYPIRYQGHARHRPQITCRQSRGGQASRCFASKTATGCSVRSA